MNPVQHLSIAANYERGPIRGNVQLDLQTQPGHHPDSFEQGNGQGDQAGRGGVERR